MWALAASLRWLTSMGVLHCNNRLASWGMHLEHKAHTHRLHPVICCRVATRLRKHTSCCARCCALLTPCTAAQRRPAALAGRRRPSATPSPPPPTRSCTGAATSCILTGLRSGLRASGGGCRLLRLTLMADHIWRTRSVYRAHIVCHIRCTLAALDMFCLRRSAFVMELRKCTASLEATVVGSPTAERLATLHAAWLDLVAVRVRSNLHLVLAGTFGHLCGNPHGLLSDLAAVACFVN
jgi:hypothetical protein